MKFLFLKLTTLMASSLEYFRHLLTSKGIKTVVCIYNVRKVVSQMKMSVTEQRTNIKFSVLLQKSPLEILKSCSQRLVIQQ